MDPAEPFLGFIREEEDAHMRRMRARAVAVTSPRPGPGLLAIIPPPRCHHRHLTRLKSKPATIASTADAAANPRANTTGTSTVLIAARNILPALPPCQGCQPMGLGISQVSSLP